MSAVLERPAESVPTDEDAARAEHYAMLSRLFAAPPDAAFLDTLARLAAAFGTADKPLGQAWKALGEAIQKTTPAMLDDEYTRLFLTIGRPEVMLFGSFYLAGFLMEEPVVDLRSDLARLGLGRRIGVMESEDHLTALCDVMRHLILTGPDTAGLARQRAFFAAHISPWTDPFCEALEQAPEASFYPRTAALVRAFFDIERLAFDML